MQHFCVYRRPALQSVRWLAILELESRGCWLQWVILRHHVTEKSLLLLVTGISPHLLVTETGIQVRLLQGRERGRGCQSDLGRVALSDEGSLSMMGWIAQGHVLLLVVRNLGPLTMDGIGQGPGHLLVDPEEVNLMH